MTPPSQILSILAGAWILINNTQIHDNGTEVPRDDLPTGAQPVGLLQYSPDGYMAANIMSTTPEDRPQNIYYPPMPTDNDSDWAQVGRHTMSYAGPFSITAWNETHGNLTHGPLIYAGIPAMVGVAQRRNYTIYEGGRMLVVHARNDTSQLTGSLFWRKAPKTSFTED